MYANSNVARQRHPVTSGEISGRRSEFSSAPFAARGLEAYRTHIKVDVNIHFNGFGRVRGRHTVVRHLLSMVYGSLSRSSGHGVSCHMEIRPPRSLTRRIPALIIGISFRPEHVRTGGCVARPKFYLIVGSKIDPGTCPVIRWYVRNASMSVIPAMMSATVRIRITCGMVAP